MKQNFKKTSLVIGMLMAMFVLVAWSPNHQQAPYNGVYSRNYPSPAQVRSNGQDIKWSQYAIDAMNNDSNTEYFDQTADCSANSPGGDRLSVHYIVTTIPNSGAFSYNDCGSSSAKEELEITITSNSLNDQHPYTFDVVWLCQTTSASGEINISFEPQNFGTSAQTHDWLDKVYYACNQGPNSNANSQARQSGSLNSSSTQMIEKKEPTLARIIGENQAYSYELQENKEGSLQARVNLDFASKGVLENYISHNKHLLSNLVSQNERIVATITLNSPISEDEFAQLIDQTNSDVISYSVFGQNESGETVSAYIWPQEREGNELLAAENIQIDGIMAATIYVDSNELNSLKNNQQIALLDLVANEIKAEIELTQNKLIELDEIFVPSPAWEIYKNQN